MAETENLANLSASNYLAKVAHLVVTQVHRAVYKVRHALTPDHIIQKLSRGIVENSTNNMIPTYHNILFKR